MNILIVDDTEINRKLLRVTLQSEGFNTFEAADGLEALKVLEREQIDAIISDVLMPNMDGYRLCYEVRKSEEFKTLPFILYTFTYISPGDEKLALEFGVDKFIGKPASLEMIFDAIQEVTTKAKYALSRSTQPPEEESEMMKAYSEQLVKKLEDTNTELLRRTEELRESEERYRAVVEQTVESIYLVDVETKRILESNTAFQNLLGYTAEEVSELILSDFFEYKQKSIDLRAQHLVTGEDTITGERQYRRKDGSLVDVEVSANLISYGGKQVVCVIVRDITERKRIEEALWESKERLARVLETVAAGITIVDPDGRFTFANAAAERMLGFTRSELTQRTYKDPEWRRFTVDGKPLPEKDHPVARVMETGKPVYDIEYSIERPDGTHVILSVNATPLRDKAGTVLGIVSAITDITQYKQAEEVLRESEEQFRATFEQAAVGIAHVRPDGRWLMVNQKLCDIVGYTREELLERTFQDITHPEDLNADLEYTRQVLANKIQTYSVEKRYLRKDGSYVWINLTTTLVREPSGKPKYFIAVIEDISPRKRAEEEIRKLNEDLEQRVIQRTAELEAANRELEAFSYSVSHDLRAPLRAIDGFSRILLEEYASQLSSDVQHYLEVVRDNTRQMSQLIDDLLNLSRMSRQPLKRQPIILADLVRQALRDLQSEQAGRCLEVILGELPNCEADPTLLKQVFVNLLSNALKFTRQREVATIEIGCQGNDDKPGEWVYFIKDNGAGFNMEYAHKLFGVFQRLHRAEEYEGTGVGLAIVQRIIHRHGGRIWAEGEVNKGATFYFTLPLPKGEVIKP